MRRVLGVVFLLLFWTGVLQAQDILCSQARGGRACGFSARIQKAVTRLDLGCSGWSIISLDDEEWFRILKSSENLREPIHTDKAFTLVSPRRTYVREAAFVGQAEIVLLEALAHEFAHLRICGTRESCAKDITSSIVEMLNGKP